MSFVPRTTLQLQELRKDRFCAQQLCYKHVGLVLYEVSTVEGVAVAERKYQDERERAAAFRREAKLAKGLQQPPPRKRAKLLGPRPGLAGAPAGAAAAPAEGCGNGDNDKDDASDDGAASRQPFDSEASSAESAGSIADHASLDGTEPRQVDREPGIEAGGGGGAGRVENGPFFDDATGHVWSGPPGVAGRCVVGRISVVRENTPREALALYCRRHGCYVMKRAGVAPSFNQLTQWFLDGQDLPVDRSAAMQRRHKGMLPG